MPEPAVTGEEDTVTQSRTSIGGSLYWLVAIALASTLVGVGAVEAATRPFGDARVLARVPTPPGFPEGIAVSNNLVWVSGPASFGTAGLGPSRVLLYHAPSGTLLKNWPIAGENLAAEHANSSLALDRLLRVYVLNTQLGIYRVTLAGQQQPYSAPFPDLKPCSQVAPPCSPTPFDAPALPNDLAFDAAGNAYVTDSLQGTIWKVPPGGGQPQIWFQDARLGFVSFGPNGIRLDPRRTKVYFTLTADPGRAVVYTLPLVEHPSAASLAVFHEYTNGDYPDGIAFGRTGRLYVAIATPFGSGVSILSPAGAEVAHLANHGNPIFPYDSPANIAFDGTGRMLVTNHALVTGVTNPAQFTVLDVWVDDAGSPLEMPLLP
jgi:sugar lactone lactonase YvrE